MVTPSIQKLCWGRYDYKIDEKGRLLLPFEFRDVLGERLVLVAGPYNEIRLYSDQSFGSFQDELAGSSLMDEYDEEFLYIQRLFGNCERVSRDTNYRATLPDRLREYAGLLTNTSAIIIGCGNRVEIWSEANLAKQSNKIDMEKIKNVARSRRGLLPALSAEVASTVANEASVA